MSNFKCSECGMINIDCGKSVFKTPREIELEKELKIAEEINEELRAQRDTYTRLMYIYKNISKGRDIMPTEEICPHCDCIVGLPPFLGAYKCPQCGAIILTCSLCQKYDCANCDFSNIIGRE